MIAKETVGYFVLITLSGFLTRTCADKVPFKNQKNSDDPTTHQRRINADELVARNVYFEGDKFWSNKVDDIGNCAVLCVRMTKCLSFNFDLGTRNCEMNSDFLMDVDTDGEYKPNSMYSNIANWPEEIDPECHHRPCKEDEVCVPTKIADYMKITSICLKAWRHAHCEDGWVFHGKYCYYFSTNKLNWSEASDRCKSEGANLVDIEDKNEDWFVRHTLTKRSKACTQIICESGDFQYSECSEPEWRAIYQVTVTQKDSEAACDYSAVTVDVSYSGSGIYGYSDNTLWVHGGCGATFKVCYYLNDPNSDSIYFMNGNDIKDEASWVWGYPEGVEMTYTNWNTDSEEPNSNNDPNSDEDCAAFYEPAEYKWVDISCEMNNYYICKKPNV